MGDIDIKQKLAHIFFCSCCHNQLMQKFYPKTDAFHGALQGGFFSGH